MACKVNRDKETKEIDYIEAPNGERSKLYDSLVDYLASLPNTEFFKLQDAYKKWFELGKLRNLGLREIAFGIYERVRSPKFKSVFGDWETNFSLPNSDVNGEPTLKYVRELFNANKTSVKESIGKPTVSTTSGFTKEVGLNKKEIDVSNIPYIQSKIAKYNKRNSTSYFVNWSQVGESNLNTWTIEDKQTYSAPEEVVIDKSQDAYDKLKENLFKGETEISSTEALIRLSDFAKSKYIKKMSNLLLQYLHNDVKVKLLSEADMAQYIIDNKLKMYDTNHAGNTAGFYSPITNEVIMKDVPNNLFQSILLHEILHALTVETLKSNVGAAKAFRKLFEETKASLTDEERKNYYFTNAEEFLTGVLTDVSFQKFLRGKKSTQNWASNKWDEIKKTLCDALTKYLGLTFEERSLFDETFEKALDVVEQSYEEASDIKEMEYGGGLDYVFSALEAEDKEEIMKSIPTYIEAIKDSLKPEQVTKNIAWFNKKFDENVFDIKKNKQFKEQRALYTDEVTENNTYTELARRLQLADKSLGKTSFEEKLRTLAEAVATTRKLTEITYTRMKEIVKDQEHAQENMGTLLNYNKLLNSYKKTLQTVRDMGNDSPHQMYSDIVDTLDLIDKAQDYVAKNDFRGVVKFVKDNLNTADRRTKKYYEDLITKQSKAVEKARMLGDVAKASMLEKEVKELKAQAKKYDFNDEKVVADWLRGKYGDLNRASMFFDSYRDSTYGPIAAFQNYVNSLKQQVKKYIFEQRTKMDRELAPHIKKLGYGVADPERLWGQLTFADVRLGKNGEKMDVLTFLNPFKGYQYDRDLFLRDIQALKLKQEQGITIDKDAMSEELKDKVEALETLINDNIDKETNIAKWDKLTAPYNIEKLKSQKYLDYAKWESKYMIRKYTDAYYQVFDKLYNDEVGIQLKERREELYEKLNSYQSAIKMGILGEEDKAVVKELQDQISQLSNMFTLDGDQKTDMALRVAQRAQEISAESRNFWDYHTNNKAFERDKEDYSRKMALAYGEDSEQYNQKVEEWLKDNTRTVIDDAYYKEREVLINKLNSLLENIPQSELRASKLADLYKELIGQIYGFRDDDGQPIGIEISENKAQKVKEVQEKIEEVKHRFQMFSGLSEEESVRFKELFDQKAKGLSTEEWNEFQALRDKSKDLGVSQSMKDDIIQLFEQLKNLSSRIPTSYYVQAFNNASPLKLDEEGKLAGVDILDSPVLEILLQEDETFAKWFKKNHIKTEVFDPEIKGKVEKWQRLYFWSRVLPSNPAYVRTEPSRDYTYRTIKDEYKTPEIVGITTDNKGNFLPKVDVPDKKYINNDYFRLAKSTNDKDKALFNILEIAKKYHLENQELSHSYNNKLWMDVPRKRRGSYERNLRGVKSPIQAVKDLPGRVKSKWESLTDFSSGTGNPDAEVEDVYDEDAEFFDTQETKQRTTIPVKYLEDLEIDQVSRDIRSSILHYGGSLKESEVLKESLIYAKALKGVFERFPIKDSKIFFFKTNTNARVSSLDFFVNRDVFGAGKAFELGEKGDKIVSGIKSAGAIQALGSNFSSIFTNLIDGITSNIINAGHNKYSRADYAKSLALHTRIMGNRFTDFFNEDLGKFSADTQLFEAFEPVSEKQLDETLTNGKSKARYAMSLDIITGNRAKTEDYIQGRIYAAYMYTTKVDYNGETISLADAYELGPDGIVRLKKGIDEDWNLFTGKKFFELKNDIQKSVRDAQGGYSVLDKTFMDQYSSWGLISFLKRFFLAKFINMYAFSGVDFSFNKGIYFKPRFNPNTGMHLGFLPSMVNGLSRAIRSADINLMTKQEQGDALKFCTQLGTIISLYIITSALMGGGDDKDKNSAIDEMSNAEAYILYQSLRLKTETETLVSPKQYSDFIYEFGTKNVLFAYAHLFEDFVTQAEYEKTSKLHEAGDKKWITDFEKITGIYNVTKMRSPQEMAKNYNKAVNSRAH